MYKRQELDSALLELLANETLRRELGRRAAETLNAERGATSRTLQNLRELLTPQAHEAKPA